MSLRTVSTDVADALVAAGLNATAYVPASVIHPAIIVQPADPFLTEEDDTTYGEYRVWLDVYVWPEHSQDNETLATNCQELIADTITALRAVNITAYEVSGIQVWQYNGAAYVGCRVRIYDYFNSKEVA